MRRHPALSRDGNGMKRRAWNRLQWLRFLADEAGEWIPDISKMTVEELYAELERMQSSCGG